MSLTSAWRLFVFGLAVSVALRGIENFARCRDDAWGRFFGGIAVFLALWVGVGLWHGRIFATPWWILCALGTVESARAGGLEQGGSDTMTLWFRAIVAGCASVGMDLPGVATTGAWATSAIVLASYAAAGFSKLISRGWWDGSALRMYVHRPVYREVAQVVQWIPERAYRWLGWGVLVFELSALGVTFLGEYALIWLLVGVVFHAANVFLFGLHRFMWVWVSSYALVYAMSIRAHESSQSYLDPVFGR